jgi:hypothetical protein
MTNAAPLVTFAEAAAWLRVSERWLRDFLKGRDVPMLYVGNRKMFDERALAVLAVHMRTAGASRAKRKRDIDKTNTLYDALAMASEDVEYQEGFVYFAEIPGRVKIGFAKDVGLRIKTLQTGCADPIVVAFSQPGSRSTERGYHKRFAHLRGAGEWFRVEGDLAVFLDEWRGRNWPSRRVKKRSEAK